MLDAPVAGPPLAPKASELPRLPIAGRGFRLFLEQSSTAPAQVTTPQFWPGESSPFRCWLTSLGFRVIRMTDHTVEYGAGEGIAYCQGRYRLPRWCREFHQGLRRIAAEEKIREIPREACLALLNRVGPHTRERGFAEAERHRQYENERAEDGFGPLGENDYRYRRPGAR